MSKQLSKHTKNKLNVLLANTGDMALKRRARRIIEEINPQPGEKILEVGCGDGYYLHLLSKLGIKYSKLVGIDIDKAGLAAARKNLPSKNIVLKYADVMKRLPFSDASFDKVIMSEVAEHLENDVKGLREVKRVLKKNGTLVLTVPSHNYPLFWDPVNWILEHLGGTHISSGFWAGLWNQHLRLYEPDEIKKSIKDAGFRVEKIESLTWWCLPFNHNLMHFAALRLHSGDLSKEMKMSINKFEEEKVMRSPLTDAAFKLVNLIDKLNDLWQPKNRGVGVFLHATKV